jgi:hypothetical protein
MIPTDHGLAASVGNAWVCLCGTVIQTGNACPKRGR